MPHVLHTAGPQGVCLNGATLMLVMLEVMLEVMLVLMLETMLAVMLG